MKKQKLTHFNKEGRARMVDVGEKDDTLRIAIAEGEVIMQSSTLRMVKDREISKGDVLGVAQVAGIMAAKKTSEIIPMCHPLLLTSININFKIDEEKNRIIIQSQVKTIGKTGVEIEPLTAVSVAALTIYDMCKAVEKGMTIKNIHLVEKSGGQSGHYQGKSQMEK
ncbi:MAG: cyclic pyranopterin monophosphate synthase MoaC [Candidatus Caldatribacteriota bacterium]|nr:cyclic pyranopterin monophosphate synthase MoaC [Candidatus Caldatribacteriota bacterium]